MEKLLLILLVSIADVVVVTADQESKFNGAVSVVDESFITTQFYPTDNGRTSIPRDNFPLPCTTCEPGYPTEFCDWDDGVCVKLSDAEISVIATNGSILNGGPFSLDNHCTPQYLQNLSSDTYAVVCKESSYHLFQISGPSGTHLKPITVDTGTDGILVQSVVNVFGRQRADLHHIEVDRDNIIVSHNALTATFDYIYPDTNCLADSLTLHSVFSSNGNFILECSTSTEERAYYWHSAVYYDSDPERIDLCDNPIPSSGGSTFAVACSNTLVVYMKDDVEQSYSKIFNDDIVFMSYLNPTTIIVGTQDHQHIVTIRSSGFDGVLTLNETTNCTLVHKLITNDIYATACENGTQYYVRLVNMTSDETTLVENLPREPLDIYFSVQQPPAPTEPDAVTNTTTASTTPTDKNSASSSEDTDSEEGKASVTPSQKSAENEKDPTSKLVIILVAIFGAVMAVIIVILSMILGYVIYRHTCRKQYRLQSRAPSAYLASGATTPDSSRTNSSVPSIAGSRDELEMLNL